MIKQILIAYTISNFRYEVVYDILPMDENQLLLGRPWLFDKGSIYNGTTNTYTFRVKG